MLKLDNINQENSKRYPFRVKNTFELIKNDNILEIKNFSLKIYSIFWQQKIFQYVNKNGQFISE